MKRLSIVIAALLFSVLLWPVPIHAQESEWSERRTERFAILYTSDDQTTVEEYAGFVDSIYDEVAAIFGHRTRTPVTLRLYPSLERYYEANPLARNMPGVVAHADFRRHEVVVIVPQTQSQTPDEIQNNIRHELTHIVAAELSEDRLNVGFQEGLAQYIERPSRELESKIQLLQRALENDQLLSWSDLDNRELVYQNPEVSYPESLSVVAFLIEQHSFAKLRDFLTISARSSGYRSALQRAFGATPDELEQQWRTWLPQYVAGGYRRNVLSAYDLSPIEALLQQGRYAEAQHELETAIEWLKTTDQADVLAQAQALLQRSTAGQQAEELAQQARAALEAADYARAADLVVQAQQAYAGLENKQQDAVLAAYAARAQRGMQANQTFDEALALARTLRYPQARSLADRVAAEYIALGDRPRADQALELRAMMDGRQSVLGAALLIFGVVGIGAGTLRRVTAQEAELW